MTIVIMLNKNPEEEHERKSNLNEMPENRVENKEVNLHLNSQI